LAAGVGRVQGWGGAGKWEVHGAAAIRREFEVKFRENERRRDTVCGEVVQEVCGSGDVRK